MSSPAKVAKKKIPAPVKKVPAASVEISQARVRAAAMPPIDPNSNSDLALAMREMLKGGETRQEVMHRVQALLEGQPTRTGRSKPVSTIINHALNRAEAHGFRVEQHWILKPIPGYVAPETEPAAPTPVKRVVKKVAPPAAPEPVRKVAKKVPAPPAVPAKKAIRKPAPIAPVAPAVRKVVKKVPASKG